MSTGLTTEENKRRQEICTLAAEWYGSNGGFEVQYSVDNKNWEDGQFPTFNPCLNWRRKPEKVLVPFSYEDADFLRNKWVKAKNSEVQVEIVGISEIVIAVWGWSITYSYLLDNYTFLDGSPCGKEV